MYMYIQIGYELDEDRNWAIDIQGLRDRLEEVKGKCEPRIMVVINPGNPTGDQHNKFDFENFNVSWHD